MALDFSTTQTDNTITIDNFLGLDYNTFETETDLRRSKLAKNMVVNQNGYVEKRTGYKRVFENGEADRINGIFTYHAKHDSLTDDTVIIEDINIIHIGESLYRFHFESDNIVRDEKLLTGLENKKTRAFEFGGSMYIIGAGYVKIGIDNLTKTLCCGFVTDIASKYNYLDFGYESDAVAADDIDKLDCIVNGRTVGDLDGEVKAPDTSKLFKMIRYKRNGNTPFKNGDIFRIGKKGESYNIAIRGVFLVFEDSKKTYQSLSFKNSGTKMYEILNNEEYGMHIKMSDNFKHLAAAFRENISSDDVERYKNGVKEVVVVFTSYDFKYAPLSINNRTPMWIDYLDTNKAWAEDSSDINRRYTGQVVEGVNLLGGVQSVQFYYSASTRPATADAKALRFYLTKNKKCYVSRIQLNDYIWHFTFADRLKNNLDINSREGYLDIQYTYLASVFKEGTITIYFTTDEDRKDTPIDKCNIFGIYGGDNDTRVFLSGNPEEPCRDYASGLYDGTYFSDIMWTDVGGDNSRIVGYHKLYSNQIIVKDGNGESAMQYLRSYSTDSNGKAVFSLSQGNDSYGANCVSSFKNIGGYPFYIGEDGFYMVYGTNVKSETNTACKSLLINKKFTKEDTANMICTVHEGRFFAYTNKQMYVCDTLRDFEWYYFDGLPEITCLWIYNDLIYFGDTSGKVYRFMKEDEAHAYCDDLNTSGEIDEEYTKPIHAIWTIPQNTYDSFTNYKTVRNLHISCMPYDRSSIVIYYNSDEDLDDEVLRENIDMFYWENIDFSRFSFVTIKQPQAFATRVKLKNVYTFGMKLENNAIDEPFGFIGMTLTYRIGKKVK